jgi:hypothetical protein
MLKRLFLSAILFATAGLAAAQTATIPASGTKVLDNTGNPLASGKINFIPTNASGTPVAYTPLGGTLQGPGTAYTATVTAGAFPSTQILNTTTASPAGLVFTITVTDPTGATIYLLLPQTAINQSSYSFDSYSASATSSITGLGLPRVTCVPGAQYTQSDAVSGAPKWVCSQLNTTDKTIVWTQNPSASGTCQGGLAIASPKYGPPYCLAPYAAWTLPGQALMNPSTTAAGPLTVGTPSGGGTAANPAGPAYALNFANSGVTAFQGSSSLTFNPTTFTLSSAGDFIVQAMESGPKVVYDPMSPAYDGGLKAAIAGTSGYTPQQVIQATIDYGECQYQMGLAPAAYRIPLPSGITINIAQLLLWGDVDFGGESFSSKPGLQHTNATTAMIEGHVAADGLTCSNGTTYHPASGGADYVYLHDFAIAGSGITSGPYDIGIWDNLGSNYWLIDRISGFGNGFGGQAVLNQGFNGYMRNLGYPANQLKGCQAYVTGALAVTSSPTGVCGTAEDDSVDDEVDWVYATDAVQGFNSSHAAGPCYPNCAAYYAQNTNGHSNHIFTQLSDVGMVNSAPQSRWEDLRNDASSREAVIITGAVTGTTMTGIVPTSSCTDTTALQSNYNAGTATGCADITDIGQANSVSNVAPATSAATFGQSYKECQIRDLQNGGSGSPNVYSGLSYVGTPANTTANDQAYCGSFYGDHASSRVIFPTMGPGIGATADNVDASGLTSININTTTPITTITHGIPGQHLEVVAYGSVAATITTGGNIYPTSGASTALTTAPITLVNEGPYQSNRWYQMGGGSGGSGGGLTGQTPTCLPKAATATTSTASSSVCDNGTTVTVSDSGGLAVAGSTNGAINFTYSGSAPTAPTGAAYQWQALASPTNPTIISPDPTPQTGIAYDTVTTTGGVTTQQQSHVNVYYAYPSGNLQNTVNLIDALGGGTIYLAAGSYSIGTPTAGLTIHSNNVCTNLWGMGVGLVTLNLSTQTDTISAYTASGTATTFTIPSTANMVSGTTKLIFSGLTANSALNATTPVVATVVDATHFSVPSSTTAGSGTETGSDSYVVPYAVGQPDTSSTEADGCSVKDLTINPNWEATDGLAIPRVNDDRSARINVTRPTYGVGAHAYHFGHSATGGTFTGAHLYDLDATAATADYTSTNRPQTAWLFDTSATDNRFDGGTSRSFQIGVRYTGGTTFFSNLHVWGTFAPQYAAYLTGLATFDRIECDGVSSTCFNIGTASNGSKISNSIMLANGSGTSGANFANVGTGIDYISFMGNDWRQLSANSTTIPITYGAGMPQHITIRGNQPDYGTTTEGAAYALTDAATVTVNEQNGLYQTLTLTQNTTIAITSQTANTEMKLQVCQTTGNSFTISYPYNMVGGLPAPLAGYCTTQRWDDDASGTLVAEGSPFTTGLPLASGNALSWSGNDFLTNGGPGVLKVGTTQGAIDGTISTNTGTFGGTVSAGTLSSSGNILFTGSGYLRLGTGTATTGTIQVPTGFSFKVRDHSNGFDWVAMGNGGADNILHLGTSGGGVATDSTFYQSNGLVDTPTYITAATNFSVNTGYVECDTTSGAFSNNLVAAPYSGTTYTIIKVDSTANVCTLAGNGNYIGASGSVGTYALSTQGQYVSLKFDSTTSRWQVVNAGPASGGGSGTVSSGTANHFGYYSAAGTTISTAPDATDNGSGTVGVNNNTASGVTNFNVGTANTTATSNTQMTVGGQATADNGQTTNVTIYGDNTQSGDIFAVRTPGSNYFEVNTGFGGFGTRTFGLANFQNGIIQSGNGAASNPGIWLRGSPYTAGTASTAYPYVYVDATGNTEPTTFSTGGTLIGANAPSGFTGNLLAGYTNGAGEFTVSSTGVLTANGATISGSPNLNGTSYAYKINGDTAWSRDSTLGSGWFDFGTGAGNSVVGNIQAAAVRLSGKCSSTASPAVCGASSAGQVQVAASGTTLTINTTIVTATSTFSFTYTTVGCTAPANIASLLPPYVSAITANTSFTITLPVAPTTNPACILYTIN